ncbi:MAG: hypothetical protein ACYTGZ_10115 [Planctomycetota bacterium]
MLWMLTTRKARKSIDNLRRYRGGEFRRMVRALPYETVWRSSHLPGGAYVFGDLERLDGEGVECVSRLAERVRACDPQARILNDPSRVLCRFALLRGLFEEGGNSFDVYRADEGRTPRRWPVFLRGERDHDGNATGLLPGPEALDAALAAERAAGWDPHERLIVEFVETVSPDGLYRKYGQFRIGEAMIARHVFFGRDWMVKLQEPPGAAELAEERAHVEADPDTEALRRVFEFAGIEYGRIDYSRREGGIEVWEINTAPMIVNKKTLAMKSRAQLNRVVIGRIADALLALAREGAGRPRIPIGDLRGVRPRWFRLPI